MVLVTKNTSYIEVAKWLAVLGMIFDHAHKIHLLNGNVWLLSFGRLAFPIFVICFAYSVINLSKQPGEINSKLLLYAITAQTFYVPLFSYRWFDLNILFVFYVGWLVWKLIYSHKLSLQIAAISTVIFTWPLFAVGSYGGVGTLCVVGALSFFNQKKGNSKFLFVFFPLLMWLPSIYPVRVEFLILSVLFISLTVFFKYMNYFIPRSNFGAVYVLHLACLFLCSVQFQQLV